MNPTTVLVIDDELAMREGLGALLAREGYDVRLAGSGEDAIKRLHDEPVRVVLTDFRMPGLDGLAVLRHVQEMGLDAEVVLLSGHGSIDLAVQALKEGAFDFLTKPPEPERLLTVVRNAADRQAMVRRTRALEAAQETEVRRVLIAESEAMRRVLAQVDRVAPTDAGVLILGESGTGKELIARRLHLLSGRCGQPLIAVNCAAIPDTLLESELFGHERGAFTGAVQRKLGRFELADGGTLFLDEVGELAPATQAKLLRALQEGEVERLGATAPRKVDARVLAATNHDLPRLIAERRFREDLFYRLKVVTIELPPLRDRLEDIEPIARHFLGVYGRRQGRPARGFTTDAVARMLRYRWPGNVRELEHAVQRAVILAAGREITAEHLGLGAEGGRDGHGVVAPALAAGTLAEMERQRIVEMLGRFKGNHTAAATALGIGRSTLYRKVKEYGLEGSA